jgi:lipopolysaccharide transport system permease protein
MTEDAVRKRSTPRERGLGIVMLGKSVWRNRELVWEMARREMTHLHAGQAAGQVWLVIHPLLVFLVYAFLFTTVFKVRIADRGPEDYLVYLFAGLAPWLMTQDVITRSCGVMLANVSIVKKVLFPSEVLVAKTVVSSVVVQGVLMVCALGFIIVVKDGPAWTLLLLPIVIFMHLCLLWGLALLLAAATPYFRDLSEIVRIFITINIYLLPILYLPNMMPEPLQFVLSLNPFSSLVWCYQDVLYFREIQRPEAWVTLAVLSFAALAAGSYAFSRLRHHFSSVI